jgi:hypothetical protein
MAAERDEPQLTSLWDELVSTVNDLSPEARSRFRKSFRTFAHDLRQACGQIQAAERLLRRESGEQMESEDWLELLDVIQAANATAKDLLAALTVEFIEQIETNHG